MMMTKLSESSPKGRGTSAMGMVSERGCWARGHGGRIREGGKLVGGGGRAGCGGSGDRGVDGDVAMSREECGIIFD